MSEEEGLVQDVVAAGARKAAGEVIVTALTPAAEELGKGLAVVAKTVNICLAPLSATIWGYEKIGAYIESEVSKRLANVAPEKIVTPAANIAGPTMEALRFCGDEIKIRELFASLLAAAMNEDLKRSVHPAYVEVIKQISEDEAVILESCANLGKDHPVVVNVQYDVVQIHTGHDEVADKFVEYCENMSLKNSESVKSYLDNLLRLRLLEIQQDRESVVDANTDYGETEYSFKQYADDAILVTAFGEKFLSACLAEK